MLLGYRVVDDSPHEADLGFVVTYDLTADFRTTKES